MTQRQALGIDINNWARIGGVNFNLAQQQIMKGTYDFLIIKAGLGLNKSVTFEEQRTGVEAKSIPYSTYFFPDANTDINQQAKFYVDLVGTDQPSYIVDVEVRGADCQPAMNSVNFLTNSRNLQKSNRLSILALVCYPKFDSCLQRRTTNYG